MPNYLIFRRRDTNEKLENTKLSFRFDSRQLAARQKNEANKLREK